MRDDVMWPRLYKYSRVKCEATDSSSTTTWQAENFFKLLLLKVVVQVNPSLAVLLHRSAQNHEKTFSHDYKIRLTGRYGWSVKFAASKSVTQWGEKGTKHQCYITWLTGGPPRLRRMVPSLRRVFAVSSNTESLSSVLWFFNTVYLSTNL